MLILFLILFPMLAAPAVRYAGKKKNGAEIAAAAVTAAELLASAFLWQQTAGLDLPGLILPAGLHFRTDGFRNVYSELAALLWCLTTLFGKQYFAHEREKTAGYWFFVLMTLGATQGLFLSADFLTAFCFFEILSFCSFPWVAQEREKEAIRAAKTYLGVAVIGGLVLLMGIWILGQAAGTLDFAQLKACAADLPPGSRLTAGVLILLGFGAKAGMFPLHIWLPKAHPVAPAPASALLSGMLTKVGVYGILAESLNVLMGEKTFGLILLEAAMLTMVLGAVLAVFSDNLKRTLACSSMSQIGFILTGIAAAILSAAAGETHGTELALNGTMLHMVNHSLLKLVLFLSAGAVAMNLHKLRLDEIQGWGRNKTLLKICFAVGAAGISGIPGLNGYLSKTLLHEGIVHLIAADAANAPLFRICEGLFLFSGGLTFAYMLRLFFCLFIEKNSRQEVQQAYDRQRETLTPLSAGVLAAGTALLAGMSLPGAACGLGAVMAGTPAVHLDPFAWENLKGALISLSIGAAVYFGFVRTLVLPGKIRTRGFFDLENDFYRPLLLKWLPAVLGIPARLLGENLLLRRLPLSVPIAVSRALGENTVLTRISWGLIYGATAAGRLLEQSLDGMTLLLRRTLLREERVKTVQETQRVPKTSLILRATKLTYSRVADNFSYAMAMLCIGIVLIFALVLLALKLSA